MKDSLKNALKKSLQLFLKPFLEECIWKAFEIYLKRILDKILRSFSQKISKTIYFVGISYEISVKNPEQSIQRNARNSSRKIKHYLMIIFFLLNFPENVSILLKSFHYTSFQIQFPCYVTSTVSTVIYCGKVGHEVDKKSHERFL